jgi:maleylacetate reductase
MLSGVYRFPATESVVFGKPFAEALAQEVDRVEARAVFLLVSGTLARETDIVDRLRRMLGNRLLDGVLTSLGTPVVTAYDAAVGRLTADGAGHITQGTRSVNANGKISKRRLLVPTI